MKQELWKIKAERQSNGVWGTPFNCVGIDRFIRRSEQDYLKESAIIIAVAETFPDETFEILFSSADGFIIRLSKSGMKNILLKNYELNGNTLLWDLKN